MRYFLFIIGIAWLVGCAKTTPVVLLPSPDEYDVYTAVVDSVYYARNLVVIDDSTRILKDLLLDHSSSDLGRETSARDDLASKDSVRLALSIGSFKVNKPILLLNSGKLEFSAARGNIKWTGVHRDWDGHFMSFSRVGFSSKHDQAVLRAWDVWIPRGGHERGSMSWWITLEKNRGRWVIRNMTVS